MAQVKKMMRILHKSDLEQLLFIEQAVHVMPWSREIFYICFRSGCKGWVIEIEKKIIGFIIVSMQAEECHVLNLGILQTHQRQGWGQKLLEQSVNEAKKNGMGIIYLEVRTSNSKAISLYRKMKFQQVGERKEYYPGPKGHEDAFIFAKSLCEEPDV